jgi:hypothetical protein
MLLSLRYYQYPMLQKVRHPRQFFFDDGAVDLDPCAHDFPRDAGSPHDTSAQVVAAPRSPAVIFVSAPRGGT